MTGSLAGISSDIYTVKLKNDSVWPLKPNHCQRVAAGQKLIMRVKPLEYIFSATFSITQILLLSSTCHRKINFCYLYKYNLPNLKNLFGKQIPDGISYQTK